MAAGRREEATTICPFFSTVLDARRLALCMYVQIDLDQVKVLLHTTERQWHCHYHMEKPEGISLFAWAIEMFFSPHPIIQSADIGAASLDLGDIIP